MLVLLLAGALLALPVAAALAAAAASPAAAQPAGDLIAVIASTSRFWFNYRHSANAAAVYSAVRRLGVPDADIVLMLADDHACSGKNAAPGVLFHVDGEAGRWGSGGSGGDLYGDDVQVDYSGADVTPDAVVRLLTGRHFPGTHGRKALPPRRRRRSVAAAALNGTDAAQSPPRLLLYMTGHGGDGFLKFSDKEELTSRDLGAALRAGQAAGRFGEVLAMFDTCQAATLGEPLGRPAFGDADEDGFSSRGGRGDSGWTRLASRGGAHEGITVLSSSVRGENSYAHGHDGDLGLALSDGYTRWMSDYLRSTIDNAAAEAVAANGVGGSSGVWAAARQQQQLLLNGGSAAEAARRRHAAMTGTQFQEGSAVLLADRCAALNGSSTISSEEGSSSPSAAAAASLRRVCSRLSRRPPAPPVTLSPSASVGGVHRSVPFWRISSTATARVHAAPPARISAARVHPRHHEAHFGGGGGTGDDGEGGGGEWPQMEALQALLGLADAESGGSGGGRGRGAADVDPGGAPTPAEVTAALLDSMSLSAFFGRADEVIT